MAEIKNLTETKPSKPEWVKIKPQELEKIIIELHKNGKTPAQIGTDLRDKHGIPKAKMLGKKISRILIENGLEIPSEKTILEKKMQKTKMHIENHKHDYTAKRSIAKKQWIISKLKN